MTDRELLQMALNALELTGVEYLTSKEIEHLDALEIALRARLAQPETYPENFIDALRFEAALEQPEPEPLWIRNREGKLELHAPPKKEWVGLTDEDREWCDEHSHGNTSGAKQKAYGRAIEAKLREKNT